MDRAERAKQFMAFAALKGYDEAVRRIESEYSPRRELSEDMKAELDRTLNSLSEGDRAKAVYFDRGKYISAEGEVLRIDRQGRKMYIDDKILRMDDIFSLFRL